MTTAPVPPVAPTRGGRQATPTIGARGWARCTTGCGWPVDPAGDDGSGVHPACDTRPLTNGNETA